MNAPVEIQLTSEQRETLDRLSAQTGKPWNELLELALDSLERQTLPSATAPKANVQDETVYAAMMRLGLLGCLKGPSDLSTNPDYMEGFGSRDR